VSCAPTCEDISYGSSYTYKDTWYYTLNATPTSDTWTMHCGSVEPPNGDGVSDTCTGGGNITYSHGGMTFDAVNDVILMGGTNPSGFWQTLVFCPGTGSPSAAQTARGCTTRGQWYELSPTNEPTSTAGGDYVDWPNMFHEANTDRFLSFNGGSYGLRKIFEYNGATQTFTNLAPSGMPSETASGAGSSEWNVAQILDGPYEGLYIYQKTSHVDSPTTPATYVYDRPFNVMSLLTDVGDGPGSITYMTWHRAQQRIVAKQQSGGTLWLGALQ